MSIAVPLRAHPRADFDVVLDRVSRIAEDVAGPAAADVDAEARFPKETVDALAAERLLSAYVPEALGGMGLSVEQVCRLCDVLGRQCASSAMVFAMHQIQVACIVHHGGASEYFQRYLGRLVDDQLLLASATTEAGIGGDLRRSACSVDVDGQHFTLTKNAPVISYGHAADAILVTARRSPLARPDDQVLVLVERDRLALEEASGWDTLGFRGTCSLGFLLQARGHVDQILPASFADILTETMHPFSHLSWGSVWLGLAVAAVGQARVSLRKKCLDGGEPPQVAAVRLAEVDEAVFCMRSVLRATISEYEDLLAAGNRAALGDFGFGIRVNNVKVACSELVGDIVTQAMRIVGISAYRNDSSSSLNRHLRDAVGAPLMVGNDRIRGHNATLQIVRGS